MTADDVFMLDTSDSAGGASNSPSLGGFASASAPAEASENFEGYRCRAIHNNHATESVKVRVTVTGGTGQVAWDSAAAADHSTAQSSEVLANGSTEPAAGVGNWASQTSGLKTLTAGQVVFVWQKDACDVELDVGPTLWSGS